MALAPLSNDVQNMSYTELKERVEVLTRRVNSLTQMKISIIGSDQTPSITITETNSTLRLPDAAALTKKTIELEAEIVALEAEIVALEAENAALEQKIRDISQGQSLGVTLSFDGIGSGSSRISGTLSVIANSPTSHSVSFVLLYERNAYSINYDKAFAKRGSTSICSQGGWVSNFAGGAGTEPATFSASGEYTPVSAPAKNSTLKIVFQTNAFVGGFIYADGLGGWGLTPYP
jgi:hypothetical protein